MRRLAPCFLMLLAGCSSDPWPGRYEGSTVTEARDCDTGEASSDAQSSTIVVERGSSGLFINGRCLLRLEELSDSSARIVPTSCDVAGADGTPSHVDIVEGRAMLDGPELSIEYSAQLTQPGVCLTASTTFVGERD